MNSRSDGNLEHTILVCDNQSVVKKVKETARKKNMIAKIEKMKSFEKFKDRKKKVRQE